MWHRFSRYDLIFVFLFIYLFVLQVQAIWPFTIDDMYISLRYARHWAGGDGLLWNLNEPPVEGYSNFSFVVLAAIALSFKLNPVIILKFVGVIGLLCTSVFLYLISRFWFLPRQSLVAPMLLLLYKGQIIWSVSGLETTVYEALICCSVYCVFKAMGYVFYPTQRGYSRSIYFIYTGLLLSLAAMTRPEAPVFMGMFFLLMCWDQPETGLKKYWYGLALFIGTISVVYCPYFLWRWQYFGYLFPNPVYCKGFSTEYYLVDLNYLKLIWPFALLAVPACLKGSDKRHYFLWVPSVLYLLMLSAADSVVIFYNRLFLPALALLLPLALLGVQIFLRDYLRVKDKFFSLVFYMVSFIIAVLFIPWMTLADYRYFSQNPQKGEHLRREVIDWLQVNASSGEKVVLADSGMVPYYSQLNFIDSYCLNNKTMGHYPPKQREQLFCQQIAFSNPKIIILTSLIQDGEVIYTPSDVCLKTMLVSNKNYRLIKTFASNDSHSTYRYEMFTHF